MKEQIEKQAIEEIASVLYESDNKPSVVICGIEEVATDLYNAGYRKQSEGEWIAHEDDWCGTYYTCSACGCDWTTIDGTPQENNMRFCPECGAHMKGGAE